jgi:hypothetical protein
MGDYYKDHFHCVRRLLLVQDYNELLLDYLEQVKNRRNDLEFLNHYQTFLKLIERWGFLGSVKRPYVQLSSPGRLKG